VCFSCYSEFSIAGTSLWFNLTDDYLDDDINKDGAENEVKSSGPSFWDPYISCRLLHMDTTEQKVSDQRYFHKQNHHVYSFCLGSIDS
jgi:hypothetical protein